MTILQACSLSSDNEFGPRVNPYCRTFDFTLLFEDVLFGAIPAALLLLILPARLVHLVNSPVKSLPHRLLVYKVVHIPQSLI